MTTPYIALLRGINVGGKNIIKMEMLKKMFENLGFSNVKTYIQSGNVIFSTEEVDREKLVKTIENQLLKTFSMEIKTAIFTVGELKEIVENAPEGFGSEPEKYRYDVWFLLPAVTASEIVANLRLCEGVDLLWTGKNAIYTSRLTSEMGRSYFSKIIQTPVYKNITIRSWNTTKKLLELVK